MMKYAQGQYYYYFFNFIYYSIINILNYSTQLLLLLYNCPKAIIFIYYGGIDLIKLLKYKYSL